MIPVTPVPVVGIDALAEGVQELLDAARLLPKPGSWQVRHETARTGSARLAP
jgi:hypothetical protein